MSTHNLCFEQKYKKYQGFLSKNFQFLEVKFSIYLNRRVFVMAIFFSLRDKDEMTNLALDKYLHFVGDQKDTCPSFQEKPDEEQMADHLADAIDRIKKLIRDLENSNADAMLHVLQFVQSHISALLNMNGELSGTKLMLAKENLVVGIFLKVVTIP